jgi:hypothetical protein
MSNRKFTPANGRSFKIGRVEADKCPFKMIIVEADGSEKVRTQHKTDKLARTNAARFNPNMAVIN